MKKWATDFLKTSVCLFICLFLFIPLALAQEHKKDTIKVLAIGNSFSQDAVEQYLYELAEAEGFTMVIGNMYIGGCSLEKHVSNIRNNAPQYNYCKINADGKKMETKSMTIAKALSDEQWDYISLQQVSSLSGIYNTYESSLPELVNYVKQHVGKEVELMLHQTWAYATNTSHTGFKNYAQCQIKMYTSIVDAVKKAAALVGIKKIIPSGTAIQNARTSFIGDHMNRDGCHLDLTIGRYTVACTWFEALTHQNVVGNSYCPKGMNHNYQEVTQAAAHAAIICPNKVTELVDMK